MLICKEEIKMINLVTTTVSQPSYLLRKQARYRLFPTLSVLFSFQPTDGTFQITVSTKNLI